MYKFFRLDKKFIGQICSAKDWPGCPGLHPPVSAAQRASVSQPTLVVFLFLAWSLFSLRIRRVVRIDELLPIAPAFSPPPSLLRLPPSATAQSAYSQINCYCCWLRVAVAGAYVAPPSPTNADGDGVSRRAQTRARIRSPFLSLFNSPSLFLSFPLSLCFFLSHLSPPPSLSHSLSLTCVSHHHHHRRISWNRSHSQSRSRRMALPSFNSPLPVTTLSSFSSSSFYLLCACFSCVRVDFVGVWPGFAYFMIYCMFFSSSDLTPLPRPPYHAIAYYTDLYTHTHTPSHTHSHSHTYFTYKKKCQCKNFPTQAEVENEQNLAKPERHGEGGEREARGEGKGLCMVGVPVKWLLGRKLN